ncbi:MAG: ParB/RepB/Spo0J family partition protein [Eubacteriales bacterium]
MQKSNISEEMQLKQTYFSDVEGEQVVDLALTSLEPFKNHPFKVLEDSKMDELVESIKNFGVATPIIVREKGRGDYEIIAGHRRTKACEILNLEKIPAFIRDLDDEEAVLYMVDTNIQREEILPSEKGFAYKMKLEAIKRQGERSDLTCAQLGHKSEKTKSVQKVAESSGESRNQVQRYIRLTYLTPLLLDLVDEKKLPFNVAVELSYLTTTEQEFVLKESVIPSLEQATKLKKYSKEGKLTETLIESILSEQKEKEKRTSLKVDTKKYFPKNTTKAQMEEVITELLENWSNSQ